MSLVDGVDGRVCNSEDCEKAGIVQPWSNYYKDKRNKKSPYFARCKKCVLKRQGSKSNPRKTEGSKKCSICGEEKSVSQFGKKSAHSDGLDSWCKYCKSQRDKDHKATLYYDRDEGSYKICSCCGEKKISYEFNSKYTLKSGLNSWCKDCEVLKKSLLVFERRTEGTKVCTVCGVEKDVSCFYSHIRHSSGLRSECKSCGLSYKDSLNHQRSDFQYMKCSRCGKEKSTSNFYSCRYKTNGLDSWCKDCVYEVKLTRNYPRRTEGDKTCTRCGETKHVSLFPTRVSKMDGLYPWCKDCSYKERRKYSLNNINYKISDNLRSRLRSALNNQLTGKEVSAVTNLGCSIEYFMEYLEGYFYPNPDTGVEMTFDNYGREPNGDYKSGWHLDHIIPLSMFDLTSKSEQEKAVHYTNIQPLWAIDNLRKNNKNTGRRS